MSIRFTTTNAAAQINGIKVLVHGLAGTGKTMLCGTTGEPTVIISAEAGLLSLARTNIPVIEVSSLADMHEAYRFLTQSAEGQQFKWVCLDSISEIAEKVLAEEKRKAKDPRQAYGALIEEMWSLIRAYRDLQGRDVYFSCKTDKSKDASGAILYAPDMPGNTLGQGIGYFFDEVFCLRAERDAADPQKVSRFFQTGRDHMYEAKDRSGALDLYEPPSLQHIKQKILAHASQPTA